METSTVKMNSEQAYLRRIVFTLNGETKPAKKPITKVYKVFINIQKYFHVRGRVEINCFFYPLFHFGTLCEKVFFVIYSITAFC